jgi:hypothetical protein
MNTCLHPSPRINQPAPTVDDDVLLLEEVDFKWLMSGLGWWINAERLHTDATYAAHLMALAQASGSGVVSDCAAQLRSQRYPLAPL